MSILGQIWVKLGLKNDDFKKGIDESKKKTTDLQSSVEKSGAAIKAAWIAATVAVVAFAKKAVAAYNQQTAATKKLENALKNNGGAIGYSADELKNYASELQRVTTYGDEETINTMATLSTFGSVTGKMFKDTIAAAQDMAAFMGTDLNTAVLQLGKALEVPELGLTMLRRSGVVFTNEQIDNIKALLKEGKKYEAQQLILIEVQKKFGGEAKIQANTAQGAWKQFTNAFGDSVLETIGALEEKTVGLAKGLTALMQSIPETIKAGGVKAYNALQEIEENVEYLKAIGKSNDEIMVQIQQMITDYNNYGSLIDFEGKYRKGNRADAYYKSILNWINTIEKAEADAASAKINEEKAVEAAAAAAAEENRKRLEEEREKQARLIESLEEKIKLKEEEIKIEKDLTTLTSLNDELVVMKQLLSYYRMTTEEKKKFRSEQIGATLTRKNYDPYSGTGIVSNAGNVAKVTNEQALKHNEEAIKKLESQQNTIDQMAADFANSVSDGIVAAIDELANGIAGLSQISLGSVVKALLTPLADAAIKAGGMILAQGVAVEAFKTSLKSLNGAAAIAAGAALIAVGTAAKVGLSALANSTSSATTSPSSNYSYSGGYSTQSVSQAQDITVNVVGVIKGKDIYLSSKEYQNQIKR